MILISPLIRQLNTGWMSTHWRNVSDAASADELMDCSFCYFRGNCYLASMTIGSFLSANICKPSMRQKMARLLELLESEKRWHEILEWAERWISFGQGPEAAYRALMVAYAALGDKAKLTATYERCVRALRELGPRTLGRNTSFSRQVESSKLNIPFPMTSFIGREKELKEVAGLLIKISPGHSDWLRRCRQDSFSNSSCCRSAE